MGRGFENDTFDRDKARRELLTRRISSHEEDEIDDEITEGTAKTSQTAIRSDNQDTFAEVPADLPLMEVTVDPRHQEILKGIPTEAYLIENPLDGTAEDLRHLFDSRRVANLRRDSLEAARPFIPGLGDSSRIELLTWHEESGGTSDELSDIRGLLLLDDKPIALVIYSPDDWAFLVASRDPISDQLTVGAAVPVYHEDDDLIRDEYRDDPHGALVYDLTEDFRYYNRMAGSAQRGSY